MSRRRYWLGHRGVADYGCQGRLLSADHHDHVDAFRELYEDWNMHMSDERPSGVPADQLAVPVRPDGAELDRKLTALRAMTTQTGGLTAVIDLAIYAAQVAEESFIKITSLPTTPFNRNHRVPAPGALR